MTGEKSVKAGQMDPMIGMWLSSLVLLPLGVFLTYKATTDSPLFDTESWQRFFMRLFSKKKSTQELKPEPDNEDTSTL